MKIAIFCDYLHSFGGTEYYNAMLASELKKHGHDVRVYICEKTQNQYWIEFLGQLGIQTFEPSRHRIDRNDRSVDTEFVSDFIQDFISWSPDVIHASPAANLLIAYLDCPSAPKIPIVATEHTTPCPGSAFWYPARFQEILPRISAFVATCRASADGIRTFHKYTGAVKHIPHFIKPPKIITGSPVPHSVGCIARMSPEKGIGVLLVAWKSVIEQMPDATLYLYGGGREQPYFERLTMSLGLGTSVHFAGTFDPQHDLGAVAAKHEVFVQPSLFESIPTSLIELALVGKPIIATDVGGIKELIHQDTGVLIKSGSTDCLAMAIVDLLSDRITQNKLAKNLQALVKYQYDLETNVNAIVEMYKAVASK